MKRLCVLMVVAALSLGSAHAAPPSVDGTDPKGDLVNPALGVQPPGPLAYGYGPQDLRAWSFAANGTTLRATITTEGRWRDWVEHAAWATVPSYLLLFRSPRLIAGLCPNCDADRGAQYRVGLMFRTNPCPGTFPPVAALVVWDPYLAQPTLLANDVPFQISEDQKTISMEIPYTFKGRTVAVAGDDLTDISAQTMTWNAQGVYVGTSFCALGFVAEGSPDWAPQGAWDPLMRVHRTTGITVRA
jgi:hypothetical protein